MALFIQLTSLATGKDILINFDNVISCFPGELDADKKGTCILTLGDRSQWVKESLEDIDRSIDNATERQAGRYKTATFIPS